ncbi:MAG: PEP-CTERM sorting domain-containing protein, partial [Planctomycetota bacterium]
ETTLLGSVSPTSGEIASGLTFVIDSATLLSELQDDTNNAITFIVTGTGSVGSPIRPIIDSRENPTGSGVSLTLIPEPGSLVLVAAGLGLTLSRQRQIRAA